MKDDQIDSVHLKSINDKMSKRRSSIYVRNLPRYNPSQQRQVENTSPIIRNTSSSLFELKKIEKLKKSITRAEKKKQQIGWCLRFGRRLTSGVNKFMHSIWAMVVVLICTFFALFNLDLKLLTTNETAEPIFVLLNNIIFFILTLEFIILLVFESGYIGSFDFYLDILAVLSLIPDTGLIMEALISDHSMDQMMSTNHLVKASSASQAGARASRYLKLVRILTFMKIVRLAKVLETAKDIRTTSNNKKRAAIKNIGFIRTTYKDIEKILHEELESPRRKKHIETRTSLSQYHEKLRGDIRFAKRDSMTATTNFHKLKTQKIMKRKVSFMDMNNYFEYAVLSQKTLPDQKLIEKSLVLDEIKENKGLSPSDTRKTRKSEISEHNHPGIVF